MPKSQAKNNNNDKDSKLVNQDAFEVEGKEQIQFQASSKNNEECKRNKDDNQPLKVTCKDNNNEIPSFIYTSAHVRDLDAIKIMAGELATFERNSNQLDPRDPSYMELEGWEFLREPID